MASTAPENPADSDHSVGADSVPSLSNSEKTEKKRLSVSEKTTAAAQLGKYDKAKHGNEHKDDIWWEERGSKANRHLPAKDPSAPPPHTGHFLTPTVATTVGSKAKYQEPVAKPSAATRAIDQTSHLLTPTPASLHGRARDDSQDPARKDVTPPKLLPVPPQYKDVGSKLLEPTAALKAAAFVKSERPEQDEREKKWVANTNKGGAIGTPPPAVAGHSKTPLEKRSPEKSTLLRPTAASKAASIEGATPPPQPPSPGHEKYVNEQYASVPSRLYEPTVGSRGAQKEKTHLSTAKVFAAGSKTTTRSSDSPPVRRTSLDRYADVPGRLHETTVAAEGQKMKKPEEEKPRRKSSSGPAEPFVSHLLQSTAATRQGTYHKPVPEPEPEHHSTRPIRRDSHLLTPTPASLHGAAKDPLVQPEPAHKPKLEPAPGYEYVKSRLSEDTAAHKQSAYVKKEKPVQDERETHWDGSTASNSPAPGPAAAERPARGTPTEYLNVASRLHQDTAAHKNSVYVRKTPDLPATNGKTRRPSDASKPRHARKPSTDTDSVCSAPPTAEAEAELPEPVRMEECPAPPADATPVAAARKVVLASSSSEVTEADSGPCGEMEAALRHVTITREDSLEKEKEFMIGELREGVELPSGGQSGNVVGH